MSSEAILKKQKEYFRSGKTLNTTVRKEALRKLLHAINIYEDRVCDALNKDLGKSKSESYMLEIAMVKDEIKYMISHTDAYSREKRVRTPIAQYVSRSFVKPSPYGCVLIVSPWNYPVLLTIDPLADALAAGNTAIIKPSAYSPKTSQVLCEMIHETFPEEYVAVVTGGRAENEELFGLDFNYIFFTGSSSVGKVLLRRASENLIPVTLELGGKSPCIVDKTANLPLAARRIVFGKLINCGQTCVAPDYIYCESSVKEKLIDELKKQIHLQYGDRPLNNKNYGKIVNAKHFERVSGLIDYDKVVEGGQLQPENERIAPTIMDNVTWDDPVMGEEIFGPIIPVMTFESIDDVISTLQTKPEPLAFYIFSSNKNNIHKCKNLLSFGGGCINDTIIHLATSQMGFGGVGNSGMGAYHGKTGFDTFTHYKSIVDKKTFLDLPMRYQPYSTLKDFIVRKFV